MQQIEIVIENTGERRMIEQGTPLSELAPKVDHHCKYPVLCALVNNKIKMMSYRIFKPKSIRFVDITHRQGYRIYITSLCFLLYKAVRDCYPKAVLTIDHWMVNGFFCRVEPLEEGYTLPSQLEIVRTVRNRMVEIQRQDLPFLSKSMPAERFDAALHRDVFPGRHAAQVGHTPCALDGSADAVGSALVCRRLPAAMPRPDDARET